MNDNSIIGKMFAWIMHPTFDTNTDDGPTYWLAGLGLVIIASFLWSRVVKQIVEV